MDALVAGKKPCFATLEKGRSYFWCACGRSKNQPFCDGSHQGTGLAPVRYVATGEEEVLFCLCKRTKTPPFCDGAHNALSDVYDRDDPDSAANRAIPTVAADDDGRATLDGGCYVQATRDVKLATTGTLRHRPLITARDGALHQSQFYVEAATGDSPILALGERHVVLFIKNGTGTVEVGGRSFAVGSATGVYIRPGEAFRIRNPGPAAMDVFVSACPKIEALAFADTIGAFDAAQPERVVAMDRGQRHEMGDRFFQMLVDGRVGSTVATQFIGDIPLSKAMPHRHLYEESLIILSGAGCMWTETRKTPVKAGDVIFLPRKQIHSLECTDPKGMLVVGVIYPGNNPSINY